MDREEVGDKWTWFIVNDYELSAKWSIDMVVVILELIVFFYLYYVVCLYEI